MKPRKHLQTLKTANRLSDLQLPGKHRKREAALSAHGFSPLPCDAPDIDLWQARLHASAARTRILAALLAPDEMQRASRLRSVDDRRRYTVARGMLRLLIGHYLHCAPAGLSFRYGSNGKPAVKAPRELHFNLSHSGERAVYAVSAVHPVGIDIEYFARHVEFERIARRFFTQREYADLIALPAARRRRAFYRLWTAKEAAIKATGTGLSQPLDEFEINFAPSSTRVLLPAGHGRNTKMSIYAPYAGRDYIVAVAAPGVERLYGQ